MSQIQFASYLARIIAFFSLGWIVVSAIKSVGESVPAHTTSEADVIAAVGVVIVLMFIGYVAGAADTANHIAKTMGVDFGDD